MDEHGSGAAACRRRRRRGRDRAGGYASGLAARWCRPARGSGGAGGLMEHGFGGGEPFTVGIEEELFLLDSDGSSLRSRIGLRGST